MMVDLESFRSSGPEHFASVRTREECAVEWLSTRTYVFVLGTQTDSTDGSVEWKLVETAGGGSFNKG